MCGIAGWIGRVADEKQTAIKMRDAMIHRGPDEQRIFHFEGAALIHNRLKILDLSSAGAQPMTNEDGTVWIVFNGEIYNYKELRAGLERKGHVFKSQTDTESILHLYEEKGVDCVKDLKGMFAFAIYDSKKKTCFLARDRFGIKPLFYSVQKNFVAFASEINGLKQISELPLEVDEQAAYDYVSLFYIPAPQTFYKAIRALNAGESLLIGPDMSPKYFSRPKFEFTPDVEMTLGHAVSKTGYLLDKAVQDQLRSDVPLGALLSGGLDSSLVSYFAQKNISSPLKTFNVSFPEKEYDETWAALEVAEKIRSEHRTLEMGTKQGSWEDVCALLLHAGQPYADTSLFAMNAVSGLIRQHVTVALSGDGGDEGFGGYDFYWQIQRRLLLLQGFGLIPAPVQNFLASTPLFPPSFSARIKRVMNEICNADDALILQHHFTWIRERELQSLWRGKQDLKPIRRHFEPVWNSEAFKGLPRLERFSSALSQVSADLVLTNDFLFKVDIASMKYGLEVRVPMLDEDLFGFAARMPHRLKVEGAKSKRVLRALSKTVLPPRVAAKEKRGFAIPVDVWTNAAFKQKVREFLCGRSAQIGKILDPAVYKVWIDGFCENRNFPEFTRQGLYQRIIMLLALELHLGKQ